jgi:hypothetical protein
VQLTDWIAFYGRHRDRCSRPQRGVSPLNRIATELQGGGIVCPESTDSASSDLHSLSGVGIESGLLSQGIVVFRVLLKVTLERISEQTPPME